jgi:hypothetical protein
MSKFWEYTQKGGRAGIISAVAFGALAIGMTAATGGLGALTLPFLTTTVINVGNWVACNMILGAIIGGAIGMQVKDKKPAAATPEPVTTSAQPPQAQTPATTVVVQQPQPQIPATTVVVQKPQPVQSDQSQAKPSWEKNAEKSWQQQMEARRQIERLALQEPRR